ncbi:hypothetical protein PFBG_05136 [Plasmodium falciparum 7G8]|uniref:Uncharacterized protein n=1 Tax=Plasmodium falciparum (isolate 7G8) TaxID=57266 RepID=W7F1Z4_PLAF8|nr:hypothetical protein PFBG_05136 [Plasmodium falciparum 7G8]
MFNYESILINEDVVSEMTIEDAKKLKPYWNVQIANFKKSSFLIFKKKYIYTFLIFLRLRALMYNYISMINFSSLHIIQLIIKQKGIE